MPEEQNENYFEWEVKPPQDATEVEIEFYASLRDLLAPYEPAEDYKASTHQFTTNELLQAIETHYGIAQGDPELKGIPGFKLVDYLTANGWKSANTGELQLERLLKKK